MSGYLLSEEEMAKVAAAIHAANAELLVVASPERRAIILENDRVVAEAVEACAKFMRGTSEVSGMSPEDEAVLDIMTAAPIIESLTDRMTRYVDAQRIAERHKQQGTQDWHRHRWEMIAVMCALEKAGYQIVPRRTGDN